MEKTLHSNSWKSSKAVFQQKTWQKSVDMFNIVRTSMKDWCFWSEALKHKVMNFLQKHFFLKYLYTSALLPHSCLMISCHTVLGCVQDPSNHCVLIQRSRVYPWITFCYSGSYFKNLNNRMSERWNEWGWEGKPLHDSRYHPFKSSAR